MIKFFKESSTEFIILFWIFVWAILGIVMFVYESSMLQYNIRNICGFDPVSAIVTIIVFGSFFSFFVPGEGSVKLRRTAGVLMIYLSTFFIFGAMDNISDYSLAVKGKKLLNPPTIENDFKKTPNPPKQILEEKLRELKIQRNVSISVLVTGFALFLPDIKRQKAH